MVDYLEKKYPSTGYKSPVRIKPAPHILSRDYKNFDFDKYNAQLKALGQIKKYPCINVCECGEEWEDSLATYQEDCYPYLIKQCSECYKKDREILKKKEIDHKERLRIEQFYESLPTRYRHKLTTVQHEELLSCSCGILWGTFGTGKTWESYTMVMKLFLSGEIKTWKLITEMDLIISLRDFDTLENRLDRYKNLDLLIIDETGKSNETDYNKAQLFSILNHRYEWEKKTILICNAKTRDEIRGLIPTAILDRYRECVIEMTGKSQRYK